MTQTATYRVFSDGSWSPNWEVSKYFPDLRCGERFATPEEAELMEKIEWDRDNPTDRKKLKEMLHAK